MPFALTGRNVPPPVLLLTRTGIWLVLLEKGCAVSLDASTIQPIFADIDQAFAGIEPPGDDKLLHPDCMDDVDVLEFYGLVRRENMTDAMVVYSYAAPNSFSPEAFRYYLPAYLKWTLQNLDSPEYASESILLALDPATDKEMLHEFRKSKFVLFDKAQIAAVKRFLWAISEHPGLGEFADNALINYWIDAEG